MAWSENATTKAAAEQAFYEAVGGDATKDLTKIIDAACRYFLSHDGATVYVRAACRALAEFVF